MMHIDNVIKKEIDSLVDLGGEILQQASSSRDGLEGNNLANVASGIRRINPISASSARYPPSPKTEFSAVFDEIW